MKTNSTINVISIALVIIISSILIVTADTNSSSIPEIPNITVTIPPITTNDTNVTKDLQISAGVSAVEVGNTTPVTFFVTRNCGTEPNEACVQVYPPIRLPASDVNVELQGAASGSGTTNNDGSVTIPITATSEGTITALASKEGYTGDSTTIDAIVNNQTNETPTPTLTPNETETPNETATPNVTATPQCLNITKDTQYYNSTVGQDTKFETGDLSATNKSWDVTWYFNNAKFKTDYDVKTTTSYTNTSSSEGVWNIRAEANSGCDKVTWNWVWNVTQPPDINIQNPVKNVTSTTNDVMTFTTGNLSGISVQGAWDFKWFVNGTEVFNQSGVEQSVYSTKMGVGVWNVSAEARNGDNGKNFVSWSWLWTVTQAPSSGGSGGNSGSSGGSSGGGSGGGGGGGGGVVSGEKFTNIAKYESKDNDLKADTSITYSFGDSLFSIYQVDVTGTSNEADITLRVEHLKNTSSLVNRNPAGIIYANENLWINSRKVDREVIKFRVSNLWLSNNKAKKEDIKLLHWESSKQGWQKLNTKVINSDSNYTYYSAMTGTLASFAISVLPDTNRNTMNSTEDGTGISNVQTPEDVSVQNTVVETATPKTPGLDISTVILMLLLVSIVLLNIKRRK